MRSLYQRHKFVSKVYKLCIEKRYTYNLHEYSERDKMIDQVVSRKVILTVADNILNKRGWHYLYRKPKTEVYNTFWDNINKSRIEITAKSKVKHLKSCYVNTKNGWTRVNTENELIKCLCITV